jgi:hypothetical protein
MALAWFCLIFFMLNGQRLVQDGLDAAAGLLAAAGVWMRKSCIFKA